MQASKGIAANAGQENRRRHPAGGQAQNIGRMNPENRNYSPLKAFKMILIINNTTK